MPKGIKITQPVLPDGSAIEEPDVVKVKAPVIETKSLDLEANIKGELDTRPCNWCLESVEGGILATNVVNGDTIKGTISAFNELMRG